MASPYASGNDQIITSSTTGAPNGAYWIGADGNVYVKGDQGVNSAGRADANTDSYWQSRLFQKIADPNAGVVEGARTTTPGTGTGGTGNNNQAIASSQLENIARLLGLSNTKRSQGLESLNAGYGDRINQLNSEKARTFQGYDDQRLENTQARERGFGQVDNFANSSNNSLQRVFQGANAGNSSVARLLAPHLVGKAAGARRQGVIDTAGENARGIDMAAQDAEEQYKLSFQDAENEKRNQESQFLQGINQNEADLLEKQRAIQADAGLATGDTQNQINERYNALESLFGQFKPTYSQRRMDFKKPELGKYTVDPAQMKLDPNSPAETRYYAPQLKKKQQGLV